jgi:hypothetical protein
VGKVTPIAVVLPEVTHVLRSQAKLEVLKEFDASFTVDLIGAILESQLEENLAEITRGGDVRRRGGRVFQNAKAPRRPAVTTEEG